MLVVRPARIEDVDPLFELVQLSELGLSTLKISRDRLQERVEESVRVFFRETARPQGQPYVFVMEDLAHGKIVGTSAVYSKVGGFQPFYSYEIKSVVKKSEALGVEKEIQYLDLHTTHDGPTEIGSLFLSPDYWGGGHGRLLSLSRFLFMAEFLERFESETIAEMRGIVHKDGHCPLWDAIGSHFFQVGYPRAETQTLEDKRFIAKMMPQHPIYIPLLPQEAQDALGKVHEKTMPALVLLEQEGFEFHNFVDIFDGGPTLHCETAGIRSVRDSRLLEVSAINEQVDGDMWLISNARLDFRCTLGRAHIAGDSIEIDNVTALGLGRKVGDRVRAVRPRAEKSLDE